MPRLEKPHELVLRLGQPTLVLNSSSRDDALKASEICKEFLQKDWLKWWESHKFLPAGLQYSCDCTPLTTQQSYHRSFGDLHVRRKGKQMEEYIIHRAFAFEASGVPVPLWTEPQKLLDKSTSTHFQSSRQLVKTPVEYGHAAANHFHLIADRAVESSLSNLYRQQHELALVEAGNDAGDIALRRLRCWMTSVGCANHDIHGGLSWALKPHLGGSQTSTNIWVVIQSLRNAYSLLERHTNDWLSSGVIAYRDWEHKALGYELWCLLGMDSEWAETLADLQLRWQGGRLCVAARLEHEADSMNKISACLMKAWQFREFSESRWVSFGNSSRSVLASIVLGLEPYVKFIIEETKSSDYKIKGVGRLDSDAKKVIAIASIASFVPDTGLYHMLDDDRLAARYSAVMDEIADEVQYVAHVKSEIYDLLAAAVGQPGAWLRQEAIQAAHTSAAYIAWRLRPATLLPWSLLHGDRLNNLRELAAAGASECLTIAFCM